MPAVPVQPSTTEAAQLLPRSTKGTLFRGSSRVRWRFWRQAFALLACGLAAGYQTVLAWSTSNRGARRGGRCIAAGRRWHSPSDRTRPSRGRPYSRNATLLAAGLSRMDRPVEAEPDYQRSWPIDLQDRHLRTTLL